MIRTINISQIVIDNSRRAIKEETVLSLMESIKSIGLLNPITVNNENKLLAGRHRLEACKRLGFREIQTNAIGGGYLEYQLAEIDENLLRNELTVLERSEHLERRKEVYEEMHPETIARNKEGHVSNYKSSTTDSVVEDKQESFVDNTAKLTNQSPAKIREEIALSKNLTDETKEIIRNNPIADKKTELLKLAKVEPEKQKEIAEKIVSNEIKKVEDYFPPSIKQAERSSSTNDFEADAPEETIEVVAQVDTSIQIVKDLKDDLLTTLNAYSHTKSLRVQQILKYLTNYITNLK